MKTALCLSALLLTVACVDTVNETRGTFTFRGETFETATRTYQRADGSTYARTTIYANAERVTCIPGDAEDCAVALANIAVRNR